MPMLKIWVRYNNYISFCKENKFLHGNEAGHGNFQRKKTCNNNESDLSAFSMDYEISAFESGTRFFQIKGYCDCAINSGKVVYYLKYFLVDDEILYKIKKTGSLELFRREESAWRLFDIYPRHFATLEIQCHVTFCKQIQII